MKAAMLDDKILERECAVFCRYLIGQEPNEYVKRTYRAAHLSASLRRDNGYPADDFLIKLARFGPWSTKVIDVYARVLRPFSVVRKKLVLLLAILESCAPTHAYLDSADSTSVALLFLRMLQRCLIFALIAVVGILILFPAEVILGLGVKRSALRQPDNG